MQQRKKQWLFPLLACLCLLLPACRNGVSDDETQPAATQKTETSTGVAADTEATTTETVTTAAITEDMTITAPAENTDTETEIPTEVSTEKPTVDSVESESTTEEITEEVTEEVKEDPLVFDQLSDLDQLTAPFWRMNVMSNEATSFIMRDDGSITAKLLFTPTKIVSVMSNDLKTTYVEGVDYIWTPETNTLTLPEGSTIPFFTQNDIHGKDEDGNYIPAFGSDPDHPWDELGRSRFGDALYCVSAFLYEKQIAVTYEYTYGDWDGPVTAYQGDLLPKSMEKIRNGESINIVFYGDSIFTGCDSSLMYNREPRQDSFPTLIKYVLEEKYPNLHVKRYNPSVGGKDSVWGVENVDLVKDKEPDLVFIGFGMNDGGRSGRSVGVNIQKIIESIRQDYPDCEFVVVAPMVPNNEAGFLSTQGQFPRAFQTLQGTGVAYVDMFTFHKKMLEKKDFISMSGNNVNHPNDWLIRVYTMNLLAVLIEYS